MFARYQLRVLLFFWTAALVIGSFLPPQTKQWLGTRSAERIYANPSWAHRCWHIAGFGSAALLASVLTRIPRTLALQIRCKDAHLQTLDSGVEDQESG